MFQGIPTTACVRYLWSGGSTGCQTQPSTTGILYLISQQADIAEFVNRGSSGQFALLLPYALFSQNNVNTLRGSGKVAGLILIKSGFGFTRPTSWSPDSICPNCQYGLYGNQSESTWHVWNPNGNSLFLDSYDFPIFAVTDDAAHQQSVLPLQEAVEANAKGSYSTYPQYAVEFDAFMYAAVDSETCLRRGDCSPVGALSVWSTFSTNYKEGQKPAKPIVVVSAKLDSRGFIVDQGAVPVAPKYALGANSPKTALVTALATATALTGVVESLPKDILFTFFDAETWAFAGSQRFVQDLTEMTLCLERKAPTSACPTSIAGCSKPCNYNMNFQSIDLNLIDSIFEFDTVGGIGESSPSYFLHVDNVNAGTSALTSLFSASVTAPSVNGSVPRTIPIQPAFTSGDNPRLPPSSAMAFLQKRNIPAVVISDYSTAYSNQYYSSEFDDESTWDSSTIVNMCAIANATARAIYVQAGGNAASIPASVNVDCGVIAELMDCFTRNLSCSMMQTYFPILSELGVLQDTTASSYFGFDIDQSILSYLVSRVMIDITSTVRNNGTCASDADCATQFVCMGFNSTTLLGQCTLGQANLHWAYGTGLEMDYSSATFKVVDPSKGTWTRSLYANAGFSDQEIRMRLFKTASRSYQGMQLGVGLAVTIATVAAVLGFQRWSNRRFKID
ncbi:hypothetical protein HKX48_007789 [Thoreauomyces humboldtii]|nr:hypothetical protein HKX48_007789 [Thoreauomyces humboldtii]